MNAKYVSYMGSDEVLMKGIQKMLQVAYLIFILTQRNDERCPWVVER